MKVLGIVPARGGSKGVPRKNVRLLGGKPLLQFTAEAAAASRRLTRLVASTDDPDIASVAAACGLEVPFLRPGELAADSTPMIAVVRHAVSAVEAAGDRFDAVCILQPTCPFRTPGEIDRCIDLLASTGADAVVTVAPVPTEYNPHWVYVPGADGRLHLVTGEAAPIARRQDLPPAYHRDGSVYVTRRDVLMLQDSLYGSHVVGCVIAPDGRVNIDSPVDWEAAERVAAGASC
jgi:CMP-N-acetylneuraminic acid synthetase